MVTVYIVFGQLVQKLEQITPNSSTLQDDQNEWSQCSISTAGSIVAIFWEFIKSASAGQGLKSSKSRDTEFSHFLISVKYG